VAEQETAEFQRYSKDSFNDRLVFNKKYEATAIQHANAPLPGTAGTGSSICDAPQWALFSTEAEQDNCETS
jgi:hypothetical protein